MLWLPVFKFVAYICQCYFTVVVVFKVQEHISEQDYSSVEDPDLIFLSVRICHAEEPFSEELRAAVLLMTGVLIRQRL